MKAAKLFELMFGFDVAEGNSSIFCGSRAIEIMKKQYLGKNGHIAIGTNTLPRAIAYFKSRGFEFNEETASPKAIYFKSGRAGRPGLRHLRFNAFIIADKIYKRQESIFSWQRKLLPSAS